MRNDHRNPRLRWSPLVAATVIVALVASCADSTEGAPASTTSTAPPTTAEAPTVDSGSDVGPAFDPMVLTVNIDITEQGFEPADVFVPLGRSVQLIIRNRTKVEHHYRVAGMEAAELLWLSMPDAADMEIEEGVSEEDHLFHHIPGFVNWRGRSPAGIEPTLEEVHGYSAGGVNDTVRFIPMNVGTFTVDDPLYPEFVGTMTVFE